MKTTKFHEAGTRRWAILAVASLIVIWLSTVFFLQSKLPAFSRLSTTSSSVPNIVHYVWKMKDPDGPLELRFEDFLSVYSASMYYQPDKIYFHTDAKPARVEEARIARQMTPGHHGCSK